MSVAGGACLGACALWIAAAVVIRRHTAGLRLLRSECPADPPAWPRLSVLIPACNEARTLEPALASLLAQDYPALEVVLVDDRSTDGTGAVVDRLAARDPRIAAVHVTELPPGWLGKVHALEQARKRAGGEWLLFTDADIHFAPGCLRRAVALAAAERLDHLAVMPAIERTGFWYDAAIAAFLCVGAFVVDMARAGRPGSGKFMGVGAFNLVRAGALAGTPGLDWLRLEVIDDFGLALLLHRAGARGLAAGGEGLLSVRWYEGVRDMARGGEKNAFGGLRYSYAAAAGVAAFQLWLTGGLLAAPWALPAPWGALVPLAALAALGAVAGPALRRLGPQGHLAVFAPVGALLQAVVLVRAAWLCRRRGGVSWRGTFYALEDLRRAQRVNF